MLSPRRDIIRLVVNGVTDLLQRENPVRITWWAWAHDPWVEHIASALGFVEYRRLHQMRISLTIENAARFHDGAAETRGFIVGSDEHEWLSVNNAAFADHEEQGGWTHEQLERRGERRGFLLMTSVFTLFLGASPDFAGPSDMNLTYMSPNLVKSTQSRSTPRRSAKVWANRW